MIGPQKQGAPRDAAPRDARAVVCTSAASGASGKGAEAMESAGGVVFRDKKAEALADLDGRIGLLEAFPFGLQHVLAMFVANLAPIAIIVAAAGLSEDMRAVLIQNAMLIAGIGTFIQLYPLWRVGSGLSIVMGISFTFVTVACTVAATQGYGALIGAVIVGGVLEGVLGLFAQYWRRIITPIVAAVVVTAIGFSLLGVGAASFGGGTDAPDFGSPVNLALGTISLVACLVFQGLAKGSTKQLSVLFGLVVGYVVAIPLGKVDFSGFAGMQLVSLPALMPVMPEFNPSAILSITLLFLVSATETVGDCSALTALSLAVGIGFTQMGDIFTVLPELLQSVFADNCVAVTFVVAIAASLLLPKDAQVEGPLVTHNEGVGSPAGETLYDVPGEMPGEMPEAVACDSAADLAREAAFGGTGDGAEAERVEKTERTAAE